MSFVETTFETMTVELTQEVSDRLSSDNYGWLTTVAKSGQPVPRLVWFYFDGKDVSVYSEPNAAKVRHIKNHPRVSLNLDSDGNGAGIIVVGGIATVDAENSNPLEDEQYRAKYGEYAASLGFSEEFLAAYNLRLKISIDKVWTTPTEG
jgi:PPOX class probable F420-dependent enzyme